MLVHFHETRDVGDGTRVGVPGVLRFRATSARVITGSPDEEVLPAPFDVVVTGDGFADVTLPATDGSFAWRVDMFNGAGKRIWGPVYVSVPVLAEGDWPDLPRVDPATLDPAADPEAAWWAVAASTVSGGEVDEANHLILTRTDGVEVDAGEIFVTVPGPFLVTPAEEQTFTATMEGGVFDPESHLRITDHADVEQDFGAPLLIETFDGWSLATWTLTVAQVAALVGTKTAGQLSARITHGTGDALRGILAGEISILTRWRGVRRSPQSLGTVTLGPPGPGIASGAIDADGELVLTLDNAAVLAAIQLPPVVGLAIDADGDYEVAAGTSYVLTPDAAGDYIVREFI